MSKLNLAEQFEAERRPAQQTFEQWLSALDDDDRAALEVARFDPELSNAALVRVLRAVGAPASKDRIAIWRRG